LTVAVVPVAERTHAEDLVEELATMLAAIEANWQAEGSGPGSRFAGQRLEVVQARAVVRRVREAVAADIAAHAARHAPAGYPLCHPISRLRRHLAIAERVALGHMSLEQVAEAFIDQVGGEVHGG
jgi:hypothetical protein